MDERASFDGRGEGATEGALGANDGEGATEGALGANDGEGATASERLTAAELAGWAGVPVGRVVELTHAGALRAGPDGAFAAGDVHRLRLMDAFAAGGIPLDALLAAQARGQVSFAFYDQLHGPPSRPSQRTHAELLVDIGPERADLLRRWLSAVGLAEPPTASHWPSNEEALLLETLEVLAAIDPIEFSLRIARVQGEAARRAAIGALSAYGDWVAHLAETGAPIGLDESTGPRLLAWGRYARLAPTMGAWLHARHLASAIDAFSVDQTERFLEETGYIAPRTERPPAVAFVDVSGFTRLAEEHGDEVAARTAAAFGELADGVARDHEGRVIKLLGDGALLHFPAAPGAIEAALTLLDAMPAAGLPTGHAGVHVGPLVARDGDIFGRTVNVASRIADVAGAGELLASTVAIAEVEPLADRRFAVEPLGLRHLDGLLGPIDLVRIARPG
jgi:adenylate cyclase